MLSRVAMNPLGVYSFSTQVGGKLHQGHLLLYCVDLLACHCSLPYFQKKHPHLERVCGKSGTVHFHSGEDSLLRGSHDTLGISTGKGGAVLPMPCKLTATNCTLPSQCREVLHYPSSSSSSNWLLKKHFFEKRH